MDSKVLLLLIRNWKKTVLRVTTTGVRRMCQILLLCCLLLMWPRRPEPRGSGAPPPRLPSARKLEPWRHVSGWTCQRAQDEDEEDETAAEEGGVLLETINSCRPTFPPTFDTSHVVCGGLSPAMHVRRRSTSTGGNCDRSEKKCLRRCDEEFRSSPLSSFGNRSRWNGKAPSPINVEGFALNSHL